MAESSQFLRDVGDLQTYVRKPDVCVFDQHQERGKSGKVVRKFERPDLERIAERCNKRDSTGNLCPITIGHTDPDEPDEKRQPEIIGYARNFRVAYDNRLSKWTLRADYFIRSDKWKEARTFPRTSVELWPSKEDQFLDPIALLRRTPQRDLGQWIYRREHGGKTVLRYSMRDLSMTDDNDFDDDGVDAPIDDGPAPMPTEEPPDEEKAMQFAKHICSHPYAKHFMKKYAMDDMGEEEPPAPEMGDPTDMPSADEAPPETYGMASPGATNGSMPGVGKPEDKGLEQYRKGGNVLLYKRLQELEGREARRVGEVWVQRLADVEGFDMDEVAEIKRFAARYKKGGDEACEQYASHIRRYYKPSLTHPTSRIPVTQTATTRKSGEFDPLAITEQEMNEVLQYQKKHPELDGDFMAAAHAWNKSGRGRATNGRK